jgi:hypothetical protein
MTCSERDGTRVEADDGRTSRVATMIQFEDLPRTNRTLLLATLELEIAEAKCANILELAHKRNLPIADIWRDICRRTGQPRCTVPSPVMVSREQWLDAATAGHPDTTTATPGLEPPAPAASNDVGVSAGTIAVPVAAVKHPGAAAMPASGTPRAGNPRALLAAGLAAGLFAGLALGVAFFFLVASPTAAPQASLQIPNAKPGDGLRAATMIREQSGESAKPQFDPSSLPPPQGTIRRLDGISKSFLNR